MASRHPYTQFGSDATPHVFINAHILTMAMETAEGEKNTCMVIKNGRFEVVGDYDDVSAYIDSERSNVHDLHYHTVTPGFIESHLHLSFTATFQRWLDVRLHRCCTLAEVYDRIAQRAQLHKTAPQKPPKGLYPWIACFGLDEGLLPDGREPTRDDLDAVCSEFPIFIYHLSLHRAFVNTKALQVAGLWDTENTLDPHFYWRGDDGKLNGILDEGLATMSVSKHIPVISDREEQRKMMWEVALSYAARGITSISDMFITPQFAKLYHNAFLIPLSSASKATPSSAASAPVLPFPVRAQLYTLFPMRKARPKGYSRVNEWFAWSGTKLFLDGSIQLRTAAVGEPYLGTSTHGDLTQDDETLFAKVKELHERGDQIAIHTNGDAAIAQALRAIERAQSNSQRSGARHRLEHCQMPTRDQLQLMSRLGVLASFFVGHVWYWGDRHRDVFLGQKRAEFISPIRSARKLGIVHSFHSDDPVTPADPLLSMSAAVNRKTRGGSVLGPDERVDCYDALKAFTREAAVLGFEEDIKGTIEKGKLADFVVLDRNPLQYPGTIANIRVLTTVVGGVQSFGALPRQPTPAPSL